MLLWNMHSWDLKKEGDLVYFPVHRHDGSVLKIPMVLNMQPVGSPDMKFVCLSGEYAGYFGYQTKWSPQAA